MKYNLEFIKKDISTVEKGLIIHGVNCQGVMGSGVAGALRRKYPEIFYTYNNLLAYYRDEGRQETDILGKISVCMINPDLYIANLYSQEFYGNDGKVYADIEAIKKGFKSSVFFALETGLDVYMPPIGCGLGGLDWKDVEYAVKQVLEDCDSKKEINVFICDIK